MSAAPDGVHLRRAGSDAVLLDCGSLERALEVLHRLSVARDAGTLDVDELVPAAQTVLVRGGEARGPRGFADRLSALIEGAGTEGGLADPMPETVIPVRYDGLDLAEVAEIAGMSAEQVVERHLAARYTVAFTGFAPGFAYLSGGDPALVVPRRSTPRPRIDAGSVGLAGPFSAVYPRQSPGGWQLIGRTASSMWDLDRDPPALLLPGNRVRFVPEREAVKVSGDATTEAPSTRTGPAGRSGPAGAVALEVVDPGLQTLVQDRGRPGLAAMGVSASGAADRQALAAANRLVGNDGKAPALELGIGEFSAKAAADVVLALTGAPRTGAITGPDGSRPVPYGRVFAVAAGESLTLEAPSRGFRTVLAIRGGVDVPLVLGSASRDTLAGLGTEPLAAGDLVHVGEWASAETAEPSPSRGRLPRPGRVTVLRVLPAPATTGSPARTPPACAGFGARTGRSPRAATGSASGSPVHRWSGPRTTPVGSCRAKDSRPARCRFHRTGSRCCSSPTVRSPAATR